MHLSNFTNSQFFLILVIFLYILLLSLLLTGAAFAGCHLRTKACYSFGTYEVLMRVSHPGIEYYIFSFVILLLIICADGPQTMPCVAVSSSHLPSPAPLFSLIQNKTYIDDPDHNEIDMCFPRNNSIMHAAYFNSPAEILQVSLVLILSFSLFLPLALRYFLTISYS